MSSIPNLRNLAERLLPRLSSQGLRGPSGDLARGAGEETDAPLHLIDGRKKHAQLTPLEHEIGYHGARTQNEPARLERAMLAALVAAEALPVGPERDRSKESTNSEVRRHAAHLRVRMQEAVEAGEEDPLEAMIKAIETDAMLKKAPGVVMQAETRLDFAEAVVRHYRPGYDELPRHEKISLLIEVARHADEVLRSVQALQESAVGGIKSGRKAGDPEQDMRAAELKDALNLTHRQIGEELHVPPSAKDKDKGGHSAVARMVKRGRKLLVNNLGEKAYQQHIDKIRPDLERHYSQTSRDSLIERMVELGARLANRRPEEIQAIRGEVESLVDKYSQDGHTFTSPGNRA